MLALWMILQIPEQPFLLLEKYGITALGLIVLGLFSWFLVKFLLKRLTNYEKTMEELIKKLTEPKAVDSEKLHKYAQNSNKVQQLSYHLLNELEADRVSIFEYHNGGKTISGVDFKKCSNTFESVKLGIEPQSNLYQQIPISTNFLWNKLLLDKKPILIFDIEDLKEHDYTIYKILQSQNIKSYYSKLILDYDNKPIGFMFIIFYNDINKLNDEQLKLVNETTITIAGLINKE